MTALIIVIYLIGGCVEYVLFRWYISVHEKEGWTVGDRLVGLIFSVSSWVGVLVTFLLMAVTSKANDRPAKW